MAEQDFERFKKSIKHHVPFSYRLNEYGFDSMYNDNNFMQLFNDSKQSFRYDFITMFAPWFAFGIGKASSFIVLATGNPEVSQNIDRIVDDFTPYLFGISLFGFARGLFYTVNVKDKALFNHMENHNYIIQDQSTFKN